nr:MAG TPA: hypothetical protein [Caudoviricetes sp.]
MPYLYHPLRHNLKYVRFALHPKIRHDLGCIFYAKIILNKLYNQNLVSQCKIICKVTLT